MQRLVSRHLLVPALAYSQHLRRCVWGVMYSFKYNQLFETRCRGNARPGPGLHLKYLETRMKQTASPRSIVRATEFSTARVLHSFYLLHR